MSFQWICDNAVDVSINKRGVVATTTARDQTVRAVSRGGRIWRFVVTPSPGTKWQDPSVRKYIEAIDKADRFTPVQINFNQAETDFIFGYQSGTVPTGLTATVTQGSDAITLSGGPFKGGDLIQLGSSGKVYSIVNDVTTGAATVNRPVLETSGTYNLIIGRAVNWTVICTDLPTYKITPQGLVEWSGAFTFIESLA